MVSFAKACLPLLMIAASPLPIDAENTRENNKKKKPHIIIMLVDDAGFADVAFNGGWSDLDLSPTRTLDRLATKEGIKLDRFYVQPICTPTRAALLTGRYAWRVGFHEVSVLGTGDADCLGRVIDERLDNSENPNFVQFEEESTLGPKMKLLSDLLKQKQYQTHAVGKWHLGFSSMDCYPENRGFDSHFGPLNGLSDHFAHVNNPGCFPFNPENPCSNIPIFQGYDLRDTTEPDGVFRIGSIGSDTYSTNLFSNRVVQIIQEHDASKHEEPLFIYYAPTAPHNALQADTQDLESPECIALSEERKFICAMMRGLDRSVAEIELALKAKGMWEDTIFWFMSDNGGVLNFGQDNGDLREGKGSYYDGGIRSPSFLAGGRVNNELELDAQAFIDITDVAPTLLGAAGAQHLIVQATFDGQDLSKYLELTQAHDSDSSSDSDESSEENKQPVTLPGRDIIVSSIRDVVVDLPALGLDYDFETGTIISQIDGRYYKFSITPGRPIGIPVRGSEEFLYDLVLDPNEVDNLVHIKPMIALELKRRLAEATLEAPFQKIGARTVLNAPNPLQALIPFRGCWVARDDPVREDPTFSCQANLVPLTDAKEVDPAFPVSGFGVGTLCLDGKVVGFPKIPCEQ